MSGDNKQHIYKSSHTKKKKSFLNTLIFFNEFSTIFAHLCGVIHNKFTTKFIVHKTASDFFSILKMTF